MNKWFFADLKHGETKRIPAAEARAAKSAAHNYASRNFIRYTFAKDPETGDLLVTWPLRIPDKAAQQAEYMKDPIYRLLVGA